jgi:hypothetical protein
LPKGRHRERVVVDKREVAEAGLLDAEGLPATAGAQLETSWCG